MKFFLGVLVLSLCLVGNALAVIIDDFSASNPGNYTMFNVWNSDGTDSFNVVDGVFAPVGASQETEVWLWTGSAERLDVGETVSLDVVALPDNQEAEIFLTTTGDQATAGAMAEFRLSVGYDVNEMILRTNTYSEGIVDTYGDDIQTGDLGGALAPSTIHVTRSADTTFDWELTGSLTGSGSMDWADAAGIDLFFGMGGYSGGEYASQMDNLAMGVFYAYDCTYRHAKYSAFKYRSLYCECS